MNKVKLLGIILVIMVLTNIGLCFMIYKNMQHRRPEGPRNEIIEKLQFDDAQVKQYDVLIKKHRSDIRQAQDGIRNLKNNLYGQLKSPASGNNSDSTISQITTLQKNIEYIHLHHFRDIQQLCRQEQLPLFNALTAEIAGLFSPNHPRKK